MLGDIRIVDLRLSTWDEATSKPYKGEYNWIKKVYVGRYADNPDKPPYWFKPQKDSVHYLSKERAEMGYEPIIAPTRKDQKNPEKDGFDPYYPEGAEITTDGRYRYGDVIFCRCPLQKELERLERIAKMSGGAAEARLDQFADKIDREAHASGEENAVSISKEMVAALRRG